MSLTSYFKNSRTTMLLVIATILFGLGSVSLFAAAPSGGYNPGETLDPDCAPGDTDCFVTFVSGGSSFWRFDDALGDGVVYYNDFVNNPASVGIFGQSPNTANTGSLVLGISDVAASLAGSAEGSFEGIVIDGSSEAGAGLILKGASSQGAFDIILNAVNGTIRIPSHTSSRDDTVGDLEYEFTVGATQSTIKFGSPNDVVISGTFTGESAGTHRIDIDSGGTTFNYSILDEFGIPMFSSSGITIPLDQSPVALNDGLSVTFGSAGYVQGDSWLVNVTAEVVGGTPGIIPENFLFTNGSGLLLSAPLSVLEGLSTVQLFTDGVLNDRQNYLDLIAGTDISLTSDINGGVTIAYTGSGGGDAVFGFSEQRLKTLNDVKGTDLPGPGTGGILFLVGENAGDGVSGPNYMQAGSVMIGKEAGLSATGAYGSNFIGDRAGYLATNAADSNFLGRLSGYTATGAFYSNFLGYSSGNGATFASVSNFIGHNAGIDAINANNSNFFGNNAGTNATNASLSNFFGANAGAGATNANNSNFFGVAAGYKAVNASESFFVGTRAGEYDNFLNAGSINAANSIFIGRNANYTVAGNGLDNTATNTTDTCDVNDCYSILLGNNTSTGGFSNSIAIGAYAANTAANQFMIGSAIRPIDEIAVVQTGGTECIIDVNGLGCSSDRTLKKDEQNITNALDLVTQLQGVTYHWNTDTAEAKRIPGFIAQDVKEILPEVVSLNTTTGKYSMNYIQIIPYLVEAIKQLNIAMVTGTNAGAGVGELVVDRLRAREICLEDVCIDRDALQNILEYTNTSSTVSAPNVESEIESAPTADQGQSEQTTPDANGQETPESPENTEDTEEIDQGQAPADPIIVPEEPAVEIEPETPEPAQE